MKYERESVLVHLSQRLMILQQGAPLPQGDLEKYIRANDSDVKVENELGLSEVPPGRNIMSEVSGRLVKHRCLFDELQGRRKCRKHEHWH